ncbi:MAG: hypothetical protein Kow00124_25490 [Anaerolineae bacterium]
MIHLVTPKQGEWLTHRRLFPADMALNVVLGALMLLAPGTVDRTLGASPLLPPVVYRVIGAGFLAFAVWQLVMLLRPALKPADLIFAAVMAEGPVVLLTIALLRLPLDLRPAWRVILWIGDVYMLLLGVWYLFVAWMKVTGGRVGSSK